MTVGASLVERIWYGESAWRWLLLPLSILFALAGSLRRGLYRSGIWASVDVGRPVIVVGNVSVGGTGKTPVALWLADQLKSRGRRPGIVSRGYGGASGREPMRVAADSDPGRVGDEPLMMERRQVCPVVVHPDRVAAARLLVDLGCDVIVADDGLQHYRLRRQYEVVVLDAMRNLGNGFLLPAGPLRESVARLAVVDFIFIQGEVAAHRSTDVELPPRVPHEYFELSAVAVRRLGDGRSSTLAAFSEQTVHAVAGIGNPSRFFRLLEAHGIAVIPHVHADHATLHEHDLRFDDNLPVLMTEKDAARCSSLRVPGCWYVIVDVAFDGTGPEEWLDRVCSAMDQQAPRKL